MAGYKLYIGDGSDNYFKYDGTNVLLSTTGALILETGGDLLFEGASGTTSRIVWTTDNTVVEHAMDFDGDEYNIYCTTGTTSFNIGYDLAGANAEFLNIGMLAGDNITIKSEESADANDYAYLRLDAVGEGAWAHPTAFLYAYTSATRYAHVNLVSDTGALNSTYAILEADYATGYEASVWCHGADGNALGGEPYCFVSILADGLGACVSQIILGGQADPDINIIADYDGTKMSYIDMSADTTNRTIEIKAAAAAAQYALVSLAGDTTPYITIAAYQTAAQYTSIVMDGDTSPRTTCSAYYDADTYAYMYVDGDSTPRVVLSALFDANTYATIDIAGSTDPYAALIVSDGSFDTTLKVWENYVSIVTNTVGGRECLQLDQNDINEPFIAFDGSTEAGAAKNVSTWTTGNDIIGFIRVEVMGTDRWIPYYDAPTS